MKLETLRKAIIEELCDRLAEHDLDHVTVRIDMARSCVVIRHQENELHISKEHASSVLYQMSRLAPGSQASALSTIRTF